MSLNYRTCIGLALLGAQLVMIVVARFHPMRYYCWAPFDALNAYRIHTTVDGRELSPDEVWDRYQLRTPDINPRAIYQVLDVIAYVEDYYHRDDRARVEVIYSTNGREEQVWRHP